MSKKTGGRWRHLNAFADGEMAALKGAEVRVWLVLFRDARAEKFAGEAGMFATAGQADIALRAGVNVRSVKSAVAGLIKVGLLKVARRGRLNGGPSVYKIRGEK